MKVSPKRKNVIRKEPIPAKLVGQEELKYTFNYTSRFRVPQSRKIIMDAFATTGSGRFLDIEMQRAEHSFFSGKYIDE